MCIRDSKEIRAKKIQKWIDSHFVEGSVKWEFDGANAIKVNWHNPAYTAPAQTVH